MIYSDVMWCSAKYKAPDLIYNNTRILILIK